MPYGLKIALAVLASIVTALPLQARDRGLGVYMDQDLLIPGQNSDRDYTMGIGIEFFADDGPLYQLDRFVQGFGDLFGFYVSDSESYQSYMLGSVNYTPDDLALSEPIYDDRPYASIFYLSNKRIVAKDNHAVGVELSVGLLGTNLAAAVQTQVHEWWRDYSGGAEPVDPEGWNNQISDGGELTARLRLVKSKLVDAWSHSPVWDMAWTWDASLGYQTNASVGMSARLGKLASPFWTLPFDPINRGNFLPASGGSELYLWTAVRGRAIGYDALMQGQFRNSEVTVDSDDIQRLVMEGAVGVTKSWERFQLTFALNGKSAETKLSNAQNDHYWGGLYGSLLF